MQTSLITSLPESGEEERAKNSRNLGSFRGRERSTKSPDFTEWRDSCYLSDKDSVDKVTKVSARCLSAGQTLPVPNWPVTYTLLQSSFESGSLGGTEGQV